MADHTPLEAQRLRGHRIAASVIALIIASIALVAVPFGQMKLFPHPGFMPAFGALYLLTDGLTAVLLMTQAGLLRSRATMRLGAAYSFSAMIIVPHLMAFPGVLASQPVIGGTDTAVWLWCAWHGGFALCVIRFLLGRRTDLQPGDVRRTVSIVALAVAGLAVAATIGLPWLPTLLKDGSYQRLNDLGIGPAILALTLAATALAFARLRLRDTLAIWLAVALFAACLDVALTLFGSGRFTLGWYTARMLSLVTGVSLLFAQLSELIREAGRVAEVNARLEHLLRTDALTGVANRRAFDSALSSEWCRGSRDQGVLSLLMIDIDFFKGFNDRYGHPAGDICLRDVAGALLGETQRPADIVARLGGEEFGMLLPMTDEAGAWQVAERARASVAGLHLAHSGSELGYVTVSIGVATLLVSDTDVLTLVSLADRALYQAKAGGRNAIRSARGSGLALVAA